MEPTKIPIELDSASVDALLVKVAKLRDLLDEVRGILREISPDRPAVNAEEFAAQVASMFSSVPPLFNKVNLEE